MYNLNIQCVFILMTDITWERFEKEGDILYNYLITHFNDMFEPTGKIKKFDMTYVTYLTSGYYEKINEEYGEEIHEQIIPWIYEEHRSGRLLNKENWKPFRDQLRFTSMYYGYRKLFCFRDFFYFQLAILEVRHDTPNGRLETSNDFNVALYGWKDKENEKIQPDEQIEIQENMMMSETHWKRK